MRIHQLLSIFVIAALFAGCSGNQNVRGALPTENPDLIAGAGVGAVVGAATRGLVNKSTNILPGALAGAMLGAAILSYEDTEGLVKRLNQQGVTIMRIGDTAELVIPIDYIFEGGDTDVKISAHAVLDDTVKFIKLYGRSPITITAHTDDTLGLLQNLALSEQQAQSVTTYLWAHGVNLQRLMFYGASNLDSVAEFRSAQGAGFNRRIHISIWNNDFRTPSPLKLFTADNNEDKWKTDNPDVG